MGLDVLGVAGVGFQLFPESGHKDPERGGVRGGGVAPDLAEDIVVGEDLPGVFGQQTQQFIFNGGQMDFLLPPIGAAASVVNFQRAVLVDAGSWSVFWVS